MRQKYETMELDCVYDIFEWSCFFSRRRLIKISIMKNKIEV